MSKTCSYNGCDRGCYGELCIQHKPRKPLPKATKPIKQKGKRTIEYEKWRDTVARPYLIKKYGEVCAECKGVRCGNIQLDVDHIKNRGSHYHLRMSLSNVQLLGRYPCHQEKTDWVNKNNTTFA